jgi:hypothetical protein
MLMINAGALSFWSSNVLYWHEWKVWQEVKLPDDMLMLPGVVSHATNGVEHPELPVDRIMWFASIVGREWVIASADCGRGGRVHPDIAWAKLEALVQGANLPAISFEAEPTGETQCTTASTAFLRRTRVHCHGRPNSGKWLSPRQRARLTTRSHSTNTCQQR